MPEAFIEIRGGWRQFAFFAGRGPTHIASPEHGVLESRTVAHLQLILSQRFKHESALEHPDISIADRIDAVWFDWADFTLEIVSTFVQSFDTRMKRKYYEPEPL